MKISILSPHIDDAAFGLTLTISKLVSNQISVDLINCFTITKWTGVFVSKDIKVVSALRKQEDSNFNQLFDSAMHITNLELLDAPLRDNYIHQFNPFNQDELQLIEQLKDCLLKNVDGLLLCPLAIGNHIDHVLCREAIIQVYPKIKVIFYEDLPYANRISSKEMNDHIHNLEKKLNVKLDSYISEQHQSKVDKLKAINIYQSQVDVEICNEIINQLQNLGGERLWGETANLEIFKRLFTN